MMLYALFAVVVILLILYFMPIVISLDVSKNNENDKITIGFKTLYGMLNIKSEIPFLMVVMENGKPALKYKVELPNRKRSRLMARFTKIFSMTEGEGLYNAFVKGKNKIMPVLKYMLNKTVIRKFNLKLGMGVGDAAATGILYGIVWIMIGNVMTFVRNHISIYEPRIAIVPIFTSIRLSIDFNCIISMKLGHIINAGIRAIPLLMSGIDN